MKDTILIYRLSDDIKGKIKEIANELDIDVRDISIQHLYQKMGYLLNMDGYTYQKQMLPSSSMDQPFVFFALNKDEQLDLLLQLFRMKGIPHIPYKAVLTQYNVDYTFARLYQSVASEYQQMMQMNLKK